MRRPSTIANRLFRHFFRSVWALVRPAPGGFSEKNAAGQKVVRMLSVDARRPAPCSCAPTRPSVPPTAAPTVTGPKSIFGLKTPLKLHLWPPMPRVAREKWRNMCSRRVHTHRKGGGRVVELVASVIASGQNALPDSPPDPHIVRVGDRGLFYSQPGRGPRLWTSMASYNRRDGCGGDDYDLRPACGLVLPHRKRRRSGGKVSGLEP